jgi:hypothetical protein
VQVNWDGWRGERYSEQDTFVFLSVLEGSRRHDEREAPVANGLPKLTFTELAGRYDAVLCTLPLPASDVSQMLPPEHVRLAPQDVTPSETHPVVFGFGRHHHVHLTGLDWLYNQDYSEFFVGIPYVNLDTVVDGAGSPAPLYYLPRLFLDKFLAVAGGVWWWGFEKQLARISVQNQDYSVRGFLGNENLISMTTGARGPQETYDKFPNLVPVANMISLPLLTKVFSGVGPWAASTFDWHWNSAEIWSVEASMTIADAFLPELPTGTFDFQGIKDVSLGAFQLRTNWTLSLPYAPNLAASLSEPAPRILAR